MTIAAHRPQPTAEQLATLSECPGCSLVFRNGRIEMVKMDEVTKFDYELVTYDEISEERS